jgi:hypothetical protein
MRFRQRQRPGRTRRLGRSLGASWRALRSLLTGGPDRQAPSWWRTARQASDARSFQDALRRLASAPTELVVGPEPPPLPAGGGRFGWLRRYRGTILWLAALATFLLTSQLLLEQSALWGFLVPVVAALVALPLGLAAATPLRAWRLQILVAAAVPLIAPSVGWVGPPWPPTLVFVALYVTYTVAVRLELHLLVGVWLVTSAAILWSYLVTGPRDNGLGEANVAIVFITILLAYAWLFGTRRRLRHQLVEGQRRE